MTFTTTLPRLGGASEEFGLVPFEVLRHRLGRSESSRLRVGSIAEVKLGLTVVHVSPHQTVL